MNSVWIKSHIDEILVLFLAVFLPILFALTVFFIVLTWLSFKFPELFNNYSVALGFGGVVLGLSSLIFVIYDKLVARNEKLENPVENSDCNKEIAEINAKFQIILTQLDEIKKQRQNIFMLSELYK